MEINKYVNKYDALVDLNTNHQTNKSEVFGAERNAKGHIDLRRRASGKGKNPKSPPPKKKWIIGCHGEKRRSVP